MGPLTDYNVPAFDAWGLRANVEVVMIQECRANWYPKGERRCRDLLAAVAYALTFALATACLGPQASAPHQAEEQPELQRDPFAVVELFTSENCPGCPAADANLERIVQAYGKKRVFAQAFHVPYFDVRGEWWDAFALESAARRHRLYIASLEADGVYVPQMVVNGTVEFNGSNEYESDQQIRRALQARPELGFGIRASLDRRVVRVRFHTSKLMKSTEVTAVLVQSESTTIVERGKNKGQQLHHVNIVRAFASEPMRGALNGTLKLEPPGDLDLKTAHVVALWQHSKSREVLAAERAEVQGS